MERKKKGAAKETEDEEIATDDNEEATDDNKALTDNKEESIAVDEDESVQIAPKERRKIVNEQMEILFDEPDEFLPIDDGSDGYNTDDKFDETMTLSKAATYKRELIEKQKRPMDDGSDGYDTDDKFDETMTLSKAAEYKRELIKKRKREEIKNFKQIPFKMNFRPVRRQKQIKQTK